MTIGSIPVRRARINSQSVRPLVYSYNANMVHITKVLSDIDGTLFRFGASAASPAVKTALRGLYRNNVDAHLVTSRTAVITHELITDSNHTEARTVSEQFATRGSCWRQ